MLATTPAAAWYDGYDSYGYGWQREAYQVGMASRRMTDKAWRYRDFSQEAAAHGDRGAAAYYGDKARALGYRARSLSDDARALQERSYGSYGSYRSYDAGW